MLWPPNTIKPVRFAKPERLDFFKGQPDNGVDLCIWFTKSMLLNFSSLVN